MTWNDFYQRQHAMRSVLGRPDATLEPVPEPFTDTDELLAALQYKWTQSLIGRIDTALGDDDAAHTDRVQAVTNAWRVTKSANPALRAVLSRHLPPTAERVDRQRGSEFTRALHRERRLLALASGLAEQSESDETVLRIGTAFLQLLEAGSPTQPKRCATRKSPLDQLMAP